VGLVGRFATVYTENRVGLRRLLAGTHEV
jgi:hypothetical protein